MRRRVGGKALRSMRWRALLLLIGAAVAGAVLSPAGAQAVGPPIITAVTPNSGLAGTDVTITGEHFTGATSVVFGRYRADFTVTNDREIHATVPVRLAGAGVVDIVVTSPDGVSADTGADDFTYLDPGLIFGGIAGLRLTEGGAASIYTVALDTRPTGVVTLAITGTDHITVSPHTLTFSPSDYATPRRVTLRALDNPGRAGTRDSVITHTTTGGGYTASGSHPLSVTIIGDNRFTIIVTHSGGSTDLIEGGRPDFISLRLTADPGGEVTVTVTPDAQLTTSSSKFQFDSDDWRSPVEFAVSAVEDDDPEGDHTGVLTFTLEGSGIRTPAVEVSIAIADEHSPAVQIVESDGGTAVAEGGGHDTYTLALTRRPSGPVTVSIQPEDDLRVSPIRIVFQPRDWAQPRTVLVEAIDDDLDEGEHVHHIHHIATGAGLGVVTVNVTITDNDAANEARIPLAAGFSLVGWFGAPTSSHALLAGHPAIDRIWVWDQVNGWRVDGRALPARLRTDIPIAPGDGFWVVAAADTDLIVPLP
jgi:hypothetical protein